jgi:hypothetical protein
MFKRLQQKWKVNGWRLLLILITFAIGGSFTGFAGKQILSVIQINNLFLYTILYIIVITFLWPCMVLLISVPLGQISFFRNYIRKLASKITRPKKKNALTTTKEN